MQTKILRLPEVVTRTGLSRSTIYLKLSANDFPQSIKLGERSIGFIEAEVESWINERVAESRGGL